MKTHFSFDVMLQFIKEGVPFSWSRWGDGEWNAVLHKIPGGHNCDGHHYFPDMGKRLKDILESKPAYFIGLQRMATEQNIDNDEFRRLKGMNEWCENEILHHASIKGRMNEFFDVLKDNERSLILVGPKHYEGKLPFTPAVHIVIPEKDCWESHDEVRAELLQTLTLRPAGMIHPIILYCASMMTGVLVDEMWAIGELLTQIHCGSVFDPYTGRNTRSYHAKLNLS